MIVVDTHAWVWYLTDPDKLSKRARAAIDKGVSNAKAYVSSISVWEVAMLVERQRLVLTRDLDDWLDDAERVGMFAFVAVDNAIARRSVRLPEPLHGDPADRIIAATALELGASLVTKDRRLIDYPHVATVW